MNEYIKLVAGPVLAVLSFILSFGTIDGNSFDSLIANSGYSFVEEDADSDIPESQFQGNISETSGPGGDDSNTDLSSDFAERFISDVSYSILCVQEKLLSVYQLQLINSVSSPKYYILYCSPKYFLV